MQEFTLAVNLLSAEEAQAPIPNAASTFSATVDALFISRLKVMTVAAFL